MPRGITPRQPAKTGRHEGARKPTLGSTKTSTKFGAGIPVRKSKPNVGAGVPARAQKTTRKPSTKKYNPTAPDRVAEILKRLNELYPDVTCALTHRNAWELLVATILSAQSTDVNVNKVTPVIFKKYPSVQDFAALSPQELEPDIHSTGFYRNKAKSVVGAAKMIVKDFNGEVPTDINQLLTVPGVARKTANVVLGTWFKMAEGVVVDTHVTRISKRLELTVHEDPKKIEQDLMRIIPRDRWILFSHQIIWHGRTLCYARRPKCAECLLENICHAGDKTWSTVDMHKDAQLA
jgi:endonuclease III